MTKLKDGKLSVWWRNKLSALMEKHYPDVIGSGALTDHWKRDGWNDGTTTLHGVYLVDDVYHLCVFPDYQDHFRKVVTPKFEHTGWENVAAKEAENG